MLKSLCRDWEFVPNWTEEFARGEGEALTVRLPHTVRELPLHYIDHRDYQMVCGYRRRLQVDETLENKRLFLRFDGAAHIATVFVNGKELLTHRCGYTAFRVEITDVVRPGENLIAVRLDTTENPTVPPFGFVVDYLTYGGLYREAWLDVREQGMIRDVYITTPSLTTAQIQLNCDCADDHSCRLELLDEAGKMVRSQTVPARQTLVNLRLSGANAWSVELPYRYTCRVTLLSGSGDELDVWEGKFGFRTAVFKADGFYLNGKKTFLRGLNRHQCYPYIGYAAPENLQREDARILKEELCCTAVRTSHYRQSHHFIDECDRLGLLVFTELPGWQHIGDEAWKDQACENVREMVLQYRNHPSIILWGVRINESGDDDEFCRRTNTIARELDPSRATSGVRNFTKSHLLEDVYAYNDFSHVGNNPGVQPKAAVTPDMGKALLVSENNGHMFPTKPYDTWQRRQEHALRHARVQDDAAASGNHAGCFDWCMFDYPTHKDFGSGDRICYHGVLDSFRNPKVAAAVFASQGEERPVLEMASNMDIGDYAAGNVGDVWVFTNAEEVSLYKNDDYVTDLKKGPWKGLAHGPMLLDDTVGCLLETKEGFPKAKAEALRKSLVSAAKYGLGEMPLADKARMGYCMVKYGLSLQDGIALYGKYVGNWGGEATCWRLEGKRGGKVVMNRTYGPGSKLRLEVTPSARDLREGDTYDMAAVRVRLLDEFGNPTPYAQLPVEFNLEGPAELVGPAVVTAEGGMCGTYIRTTGETGKAMLTVKTAQTDPVTVEFTVE